MVERLTTRRVLSPFFGRMVNNEARSIPVLWENVVHHEARSIPVLWEKR